MQCNSTPSLLGLLAPSSEELVGAPGEEFSLKTERKPSTIYYSERATQGEPAIMKSMNPEPSMTTPETGHPAVSNGDAVAIEPPANKDALSLVERLDPAIGEATSVAGAMLTELLRRTLRGGVMRIGDEMHDYVSQKIDIVVAERRPVLEQIASEVAEHTARTAATEVATEEVRALEKRTHDGDRELAAQIEAAARTAQETTAQTAEALATQIQDAEQRARAALAQTAETVQQQAAQTTESLTAQIQEAERHARAAQEEAQKFAERAREGTARFKAKLAELETTATGLSTQQQALRQDLVRHVEESQSRLRDELRELTRVNEALTARVVELERPRGLRALFAWLFGRRKPKAPPAP
jgi:hypothetical protein